MGYGLGVDLGTTFTSAAVSFEGRVEAVNLGTRTAVLPTVVFAREDGDVLVGDSAESRGVLDPGRVAREFKRRLGDTTPLILGGVAYSAEVLMGHVFEHVLRVVTERMGAAPDAVVVTHPATYTNYRLDLLRDAVARAGITNVEFMAEPRAAALHYASLGRVPDGAAIAVYDLGGGTFDAAVLRRTADGFEMLGEAKGLERLGGIDFDASVLEHVDARLGDQLGSVVDDDAARAGLARLRSDSRHAKEMLSADTETTIPVIVPGVVGNVTLTRRELESVLRPRIRESVAVLRSAIESAGLQPSDLHGVLLVGGSSRIPLVRVVLHAEFDVPVTADVDPEMAVAFGAAQLAATIPVMAPRPLAPPVVAEPPMPVPAPHVVAAPSPSPPARVSGRRNPKRMAAIGLGLTVVAVAAAVLINRGDDGGDAGSTTTSIEPDSTLGNSDCERARSFGKSSGIRRQDRPAFAEEGCNLVGLNLAGANLASLDLSGADFAGANLRGAKLAGSICVQCDFTNADLSSADLSEADLGDAVFDGAILQSADLTSARVDGASLNAESLLGPLQGEVTFVNTSKVPGSAQQVATAANLEPMGLVFGAVASGNQVHDTSFVSCSGSDSGSVQRMLVLYINVLGGVQAAEIDFTVAEEQVSLPRSAQTQCYVLVGSDFTLALTETADTSPGP